MKKFYIMSTIISLTIAFATAYQVSIKSIDFFFERNLPAYSEKYYFPEIIGAKEISEKEAIKMEPLEEINSNKLKYYSDIISGKYYFPKVTVNSPNENCSFAINTIITTKNAKKDVVIKRLISPENKNTEKGYYTWGYKYLIDTNKGLVTLKYVHSPSESLLLLHLASIVLAFFITFFSLIILTYFITKTAVFSKFAKKLIKK